MALDPLTPPPVAPDIDDTEEEFDDHAFALVAWYTVLVTQLNLLIAWLNSNIGNYTIVTIAEADSNLSASQGGKYCRFTNTSAKTYTVADTGLTGNPIFNLRNAAANNLTIVESSVTINAPAGGTLVIPQNGTASLVRVSAGVFDLIGQTVPA